MFLTLISLAAAQDLGPSRLHLGVQSTTNDPFVSTTMGTLSLSRDLSPWLAVELGGGLAALPPESSWKALTTQLTQGPGIYPDLAYLRAMGWTGLRASPLHQQWGELSSQVGIHLGLAAIYSIEGAHFEESDTQRETSPAARYGLHSSLSWQRWGLDLSMSRTRHEESFGTRGNSPYTASRQNVWVNLGLSCRL